MVQMTFDNFISTGYTFPRTGGTLVLTLAENTLLEDFEFLNIAANYAIIGVTATENGEDISVTEVTQGEDYYIVFSTGGEDVEITITVGTSPSTSYQSEAYNVVYTYAGASNSIQVAQEGGMSGYKWLPITEDFDRSLIIKKWRFDVSCPITGNYDGALAELPNIDIKTCWNKPLASNGYAFSNRFNLGQKYFSNRYYNFTDGKWTATTTSHTTLISGTTYEFECPVDLYWAGNYSSPWNSNIPNYMSAYVQAITFEVDVNAINAEYSGTSSSVTVTADEGMTWTASTSNSWLSITNPTGTGNGSFTVVVSANSLHSPKTGTVTVTSSNGDELPVYVSQAKAPIVVAQKPLYRNGDSVIKMYRSGELIYQKLEEESPTPPAPTWQWVEITSNFDRSIPFTKVRWNLSDDVGASWAVVNGVSCNGFFSESPNINCDGLAWNTVSGSTYGYAGQNRFTLRIPGVNNGRVFSSRSEGFTDRSITSYCTQVDTNIYEYTFPVTLYWGGLGAGTGPYSSVYGTGVYVYIEVPTA